MIHARHSLVFAVGLLGAALIWSCGGKVEVVPGQDSDAGVGGAAGKGGSAGKGGQSLGGQGGQGWGGQGGQGWGGQGWGGQGGQGWGGQGWGGQGGQGWGGQGAGGWGGQGWGGQGMGGADSGTGYGVITGVKFYTPFLLDADKINDNTYIQQHGDGVLYTAAFYGYYGAASKPVPSANGQVIVYGTHSPASQGYPPSVQIAQYSYDGQNQVLNPLVEFYFTTDKIQVGQLEVGFSATSGAYLILYNELNGGQDYCAVAIAAGYVQISQATNTANADGGVLAFDGVNLPLYYPTETPWGDVSQSLGTVCAKE